MASKTTPPSFCSPKLNNRPLNPSAQFFLEHLELPLQHPLCENNEDVRPHAFHEDLSSSVGRGVFEIPSAVNLLKNTLNTTSANTDSLLSSTMEVIPPPAVGPISLVELHDGSYYELFLTASTMSAPTLAMAELWLRLFAFFLAPLCLAWLIHREIRLLSGVNKGGKERSRKGEKKGNNNVQTHGSTDENILIAICILGLASSSIIFTDSLYVYEYGRNFGFSLFIMSVVLAAHACLSLSTQTHDKSKVAFFRGAVFAFIFGVVAVLLRSDGGHMANKVLNNILSKVSLQPSAVSATVNDMAEGVPKDASQNPLKRVLDPGIDIPTIDPGLYFSSKNALASLIASHWPESSRTYTVETGATPYLVNGDQRTGIPFLVNKVEEQEYVRAWVRNPFDGEILALDIAFPYYQTMNGEGGVEDSRTFAHDFDKPVYLVLHGLNGGSHEEYVKDFVKRRRSEGNTVVVLIARGMMDTFITNGWNVFHGARTGDVDIAARAIRRGLDSLAKAMGKPHRQILGGVGYSMGAIILSNYVARSGEHCALDAAMAISGGLDMRQQLNFKRSMRLWQPMLTFGLREDILIGKYSRHYKHRLSKEQFLSMLRVTSISELDVQAIATYNSFDNLVHYYSEMSAMGDRYPAEFQLFEDDEVTNNDQNTNNTSWGRIAGVSVPFAVLQALDDPLVGWRTIGTNDPQALADAGTGNIMLALTKGGGHVGWPLGSNPKKHGWKWMNDAARDFVVAVDKATKDLRQHNM